MIQIISERQTKEVVCYEHQFQNKDYYKGDYFTAGFVFPSDKDGNILTASMCKEAIDNYNRVKTDEKYIDFGVQKITRCYTEPAVGKCVCGARIILDGSYMGASCCDECGRWYSMNGQELNPPEQWEEPLEEDW